MLGKKKLEKKEVGKTQFCLFNVNVFHAVLIKNYTPKGK